LKTFLTQFKSTVPLTPDPPVICFWKWIGWKDYEVPKKRNLESVSDKNELFFSPTRCIPAFVPTLGPPKFRRAMATDPLPGGAATHPPLSMKIGRPNRPFAGSKSVGRPVFNWDGKIMYSILCPCTKAQTQHSAQAQAIDNAPAKPLLKQLASSILFITCGAAHCRFAWRGGTIVRLRGMRSWLLACCCLLPCAWETSEWDVAHSMVAQSREG
jgi:hypothetical protein